jgi:hypothetical protein
MSLEHNCTKIDSAGAESAGCSEKKHVPVQHYNQRHENVVIIHLLVLAREQTPIKRLARSMITHSSRDPSSICSNCFVYGTLMSTEVLRTLLGRVPQMKSPAYLPQQYSRHPVIGQMYPGVIQCDGLKETSFSKSWTDIQNSCVEGILLTDVSLSEVKILDWYEDVDYRRCNVPVSIHNGKDIFKVDAEVYIWCAGESFLDLESSWSFEQFCSERLDWYLRATVGPCRKEIDRNDLDTVS